MNDSGRMVAQTPRGRVVPALAVAYVLLVTATLGYFILRIPIQVGDGFGNMVDVLDGSLLDIFIRKSTNESYFRPLMWPPYRVVMDLSGGAYMAWFKGLQVLQVGALLLLLVRWLRVRSVTELAALPLGVAMLVGGHTFAGAVLEAHPINHFLSIALCCVAGVTLAAEPWRRLNDAVAVLILVYAALTLESGLLVWVILCWAWVLGWRGVSRPALAVMTLGVLAYGVARVFWLQTGTPGLMERSSGFGFAVLEPEALVARFGANPLVFYAYNVASALAMTLFAEPRGGLWRFVRSLVEGSGELWTRLNVFCACGATALVAADAWRHRTMWRLRTLTHDDRIVLMLPVVLLANAVFSFAYLKDVVMAPAGVFLAAAACVALRRTAAALGHARPSARSLLAAAALGLLVCGWAVKHIGVHYALRRMNAVVRRDWAFVDEFIADNHVPLDTPSRQALRQALEESALLTPAAPPFPTFPWSAQWYDENQ